MCSPCVRTVGAKYVLHRYMRSNLSSQSSAHVVIVYDRASYYPEVAIQLHAFKARRPFYFQMHAAPSMADVWENSELVAQDVLISGYYIHIMRSLEAYRPLRSSMIQVAGTDTFKALTPTWLTLHGRWPHVYSILCFHAVTTTAQATVFYIYYTTIRL